MSRIKGYTDMGWPEEDALWAYELLSEPLLSSELARLAESKSFHKTDCITFQPCPNFDERSQDRYVVIDWQLDSGTWQFRAIFDGHAGHDTVDHVVETLPPMIETALTMLLSGGNKPSSESVSHLLVNAISSFDDQLTEDVLGLFPDPTTILQLSDAQIREIINDDDSGGANAKIIARCMRGSTVLVSLVDPTRSNIWVASLGDCQAALGVQGSDGHWDTSLLSSFHNGTNKAEQERVKLEHPGEAECIVDERVLGTIAVTRAVGDHLFKLPTIYTERVFMNAERGFKINKKIGDFIGRNMTPPYISNRADVRHVEIVGREAFLIMCSDGLLDLYEDTGLQLDSLADKWVQLVAKREKPWDASNLALYLLRDSLGGNNAEKVSRMMTVEMTCRWMDDTTIIVQRL